MSVLKTTLGTLQADEWLSVLTKKIIEYINLERNDDL